ncbi:MAG: TRAP transporter small permease subunit [Phyllobacteriaceae bacterium]|nr:TRAP transporter small permease subunit [Phyllobacteriaceae bacterium]
MPGLSFTLPHWLYWVGLIVFPLVAMALARRPKPARQTYSTALSYLILITGGLVGLHRLYLKNIWGLLFIPIFLFVLFANANEREARSAASDADNLVRVAERTIEREEPRLKSAESQIDDLRAEVAAAEEGSFARRGAERKLKRTEDQVEKSRVRLDEARAELEEIKPLATVAQDNRSFWSNAARNAFYVLLAMMAVDALLIPMLVRKANASIGEEEVSEAEAALAAAEATEERKQDSDYAKNWIDRLSLFCGEFVSYWAVIAVFVYYFEVISRYVFNSPTNWAHEAMYLMFGMQYLIAGAYAMLTESHVRVDVFYAPMSPRRKAITDLLTSIFFFIFAGTLLVTSWIFAFDAIAVPSGNSVVSDWARGQYGFFEMLGKLTLSEWTDPNIRWGEISFNEWEVPLWPMKWVMVLGGLLLVLQGISKLAQDFRAVMRGA